MKNYACKFNALRLTVFGDLEPVWVEDFSTSQGLGAPIGFGCDRVNVVSTRDLQKVSAQLGFTVVGYVDAYGYDKNFTPNPSMESISGYDRLMGPGILCGWANSDYAPLETWQVEELTRRLPDHAAVSPEKYQAALACFREVGQEEYERGLKCAEDHKFKTAHELFQQAAQKGFLNGLNAMAVDFLEGEGVEQDVAWGLTLMEQAAGAGSAAAARNLGKYYLFGEHGLAADSVKAMKYLKMGAMAHDSQAMVWLGRMYICGYEETNGAKAAYWLQEAILQGEADAWAFLGLLINRGTFYGDQPCYVRYCYDKCAEMYEATLDDVIAYLQEEENAEAVKAAKPLAPRYPRLPRWLATGEFSDPFDDMTKAYDLLKDEKNAQAGMELLEKAAATGCSLACSGMGNRLMDVDQGDHFRTDESGEVTAFPADVTRAVQYLKQAIYRGSLANYWCLLFMEDDLQRCREYMKFHAELTSDLAEEKYVLPNLTQALELARTEAVTPPWEDHYEEFEQAEKALSHLFTEQTPIEARIYALERAREPKLKKELEKLRECYRYILRILPPVPKITLHNAN